MERRLALEAGAGRVAEADPPVFHRRVVGEAAKWLKDAGIGFAAPQREAAGGGERQQITPVRQEAPR